MISKIIPNLIEDLDNYSFRKGWPRWTFFVIPIIYWTTWPIIEYRFSNWVYYKVKVPIIRQLLRLISFIWHRFTCTFMTVEISERAIIGKGIFIAHFGDIVISHGSKIGDYVSIHQGVTLGGAGRKEKYGDPTIGNNVYLGAGAKIIGPITIGNNVLIGCNAVVVKDFPDNVTIGGIPSKILSNQNSLEFIHKRNSGTYIK